MTYFLVMGSLALSVLFTLGWALSRLLRWVASGFPLRSAKSAGKARGTARRRGGTAQKSAATRRAAKADSAKPRASNAKAASKPPSEPWRLTRRLAKWRSSTALALVAALVYLVARLAEHGMSYRPPYAAPSGFDSLVTGLGWLCAALVVIALLHRLAARRCR